jgi:capsid protein
MFLEKTRTQWGAQFCQPIYRDWLLGELLNSSIQAEGFLESWRRDDTAGRYIVAAWTRAEWSGHVKPTTDPLKMAKGLDLMLALGLTNFTRAARETTGTKFRNNLRRQRREREMADEAGITLGTTVGSTADPPPIDGEAVPD